MLICRRSAHDVNVPETGVVEGTVRAIFNSFATELARTVHFETPEWLGIDEIHILKKPRAVIGNVRENTIIDMLPDRSKTPSIVIVNTWNKKSPRY